jgi:AcrR family transcriptional regulator
MADVVPQVSRARPIGEPTLQAVKSANTRARLIEATISCIVKYGYASATTPRVAAEAGLSRGAMMHHFQSGAALMQAAIAELHEKRLRAFRRGVENRPHDVGTLVRTYWKQLSSPAFIAFHELAVAARTDRGLARILVPAEREFQARWYELATQLFPEWQADKARFRLALSLSQTMLEGMAVARLTGTLDKELVEPLLQNLEVQILALKPENP